MVLKMKFAYSHICFIPNVSGYAIAYPVFKTNIYYVYKDTKGFPYFQFTKLLNRMKIEIIYSA